MANGLLDFAQSPEGQGLLAAAFSGLANARKGAPLNTIGAAGLGGLQGYSGALDRQTQQANQSRQNEFQTLQMEKMRRDMNAPPERTKSIQEFEYAKQQGYKGEYPEFLRDMGAAQPYYTPIPTEQGYMSFNSRSGGWAPMLGTGGRPVRPASLSPELQAQVSGAKAQAEAGVKSKTEAQTAVNRSDVMLGQIAQAEKLLEKNPTGSYAGAMVDTLGRTVGISSESAKTAAQLKAVSGWLVANVPRMEGPQSNFDVQNYQQMAGAIGDETRPVAERVAALEEVKKLQEKYRQFNQDKTGGSPAAATANGGSGAVRSKAVNWSSLKD